MILEGQLAGTNWGNSPEFPLTSLLLKCKDLPESIKLKLSGGGIMNIMPYEKRFPIPLSELHFSRYKKFILSRYKRALTEDSYIERHHIFPRSFGGTNRIDNIIILTGREHFIAHMILYKAFGGKMTSAFWYMSNNKREHSFPLSSKQYESLKEANSKTHSERMSGENNPFYGKDHSDEFKQWSSQKHKGKKLSEEQIENIKRINTGLKRSEETKKKMGKAKKGKYSKEVVTKMVNPKTNKFKWVPNEDIEEWEKRGWKIGGNKHSEKTKQKLSDIRKGFKVTEETKKKISNTLKGKEITESTRSKISSSLSNRLQVYLDDDLRYIPKEELEKYQKKGYKIGNPKRKGNKNVSSIKVEKFLDMHESELISFLLSNMIDREIQELLNKLTIGGKTRHLSTIIRYLEERNKITVKKFLYLSPGKRDKKTLVELK